MTATNAGTAVSPRPSRTTAGNYTFRNLVPGTYDLTAALEGFKELRQRGVPVSAGNPIRVDLTLELGTLAETVNVVAETHAAADGEGRPQHRDLVQGGDQPAAEPVSGTTRRC